MMLRKPSVVLFLLAIASGWPAHAQEPRAGYGAVLGNAVIPDGQRSNSEGYGVRLLIGQPLSQTLDLEYHAGSDFLQRRVNKQYDVYYSLGLNLKYNVQQVGDFSPFFIAGLGLAREDEVVREELRPYADLGAGFTYPLPINNVAVRGDTRYHLVYGSESAARETFSDLLFHLGLQFSFLKDDQAVRDADGDGVTDKRDRCPNTPAGTEVDGRGCPVESVDSDGDGVPDRDDLCPGTPPGTAVDAAGCAIAAPQLVPEPAEPISAATDDDGDGVGNAQDLCPGTPKGLLVDATGCLIEQTTVLDDVQFETDESTLTPLAKTTLKAVAASLKLQPRVKLEIAGHTDSLGTQNHNLNLSLNRAKAVERFLIAEGIDGLRLQSEGYGEYVPVDTNETEEGRAKNRRVVFKVLEQRVLALPVSTESSDAMAPVMEKSMVPEAPTEPAAEPAAEVMAPVMDAPQTP